MSKYQDNRIQKWQKNRPGHFPYAFCPCRLCGLIRYEERRRYGQGEIFDKPELVEVHFV